MIDPRDQNGNVLNSGVLISFDKLSVTFVDGVQFFRTVNGQYELVLDVGNYFLQFNAAPPATFLCSRSNGETGLPIKVEYRTGASATGNGITVSYFELEPFTTNGLSLWAPPITLQCPDGGESTSLGTSGVARSTASFIGAKRETCWPSASSGNNPTPL